ATRKPHRGSANSRHGQTPVPRASAVQRPTLHAETPEARAMRTFGRSSKGRPDLALVTRGLRRGSKETHHTRNPHRRTLVPHRMPRGQTVTHCEPVEPRPRAD